MYGFRSFNYLLASLISSGLTYYYLNNINEKQIQNIKKQLDDLLKENIQLRKEVELDENIEKLVVKMETILSKIMDEILKMDLKSFNSDLNSEINNMCKKIIFYLKTEKEEKISSEYENIKDKILIESYDKLSDELNKLKED